MNTIYSVILAGGSGKRLWPLSTIEKPKQFLPLHGTTLLEATVNRMAQVSPQMQQMVVTTAQYAETVQQLVGQKITDLALEPAARNTAPAVLFACYEIMKKSTLCKDPLVVIAPADHYIQEIDSFVTTVQQAIAYAAHNDKIVLIGIQPTAPATQYGYIEVAHAGASLSVLPVCRFHEKPQQQVAQAYVARGMWWNSGIVCARISVLLQEFAKYAPQLVAAIDSYDAMPSVSIDYAVLEKSTEVVAVKGNFLWSDVGSVESFTEIAGSAAVAALLEHKECA